MRSEASYGRGSSRGHLAGCSQSRGHDTRGCSTLTPKPAWKKKKKAKHLCKKPKKKMAKVLFDASCCLQRDGRRSISSRLVFALAGRVLSRLEGSED